MKISTIKEIVCEYFNLSVSDIDECTRKREILIARQTAMKLCKIHTNESLTKIGMSIGNKDHTTVMHACKTVDNLIETDRKYSTQYKQIEGIIIEKNKIEHGCYNDNSGLKLKAI